jgi:hypothetical protein
VIDTGRVMPPEAPTVYVQQEGEGRGKGRVRVRVRVKARKREGGGGKGDQEVEMGVEKGTLQLKRPGRYLKRYSTTSSVPPSLPKCRFPSVAMPSLDS